MKGLKRKDGIIILAVVILVFITTKDFNRATTTFIEGITVVSYLGYLTKFKRLSKKVYRSLVKSIKIISVITILLTLYFYFI